MLVALPLSVPFVMIKDGLALVSKSSFPHTSYTIEQQECLACAELLRNGFHVLGSAEKYGVRLPWVTYVVGWFGGL